MARGTSKRDAKRMCQVMQCKMSAHLKAWCAGSSGVGVWIPERSGHLVGKVHPKLSLDEGSIRKPRLTASTGAVGKMDA